MTSSPSPFANTGKLQVLPQQTTLLFTQPINNTMGHTTHIRQATTPNGTIYQQPVTSGTIYQQPVTSGIVTTPTNIVRVNPTQTIQPQHTIQNQTAQYVPQTVWTNTISQAPHQQQQFTLQKQTQPSSVLQYATIKNEPIQQQSPIMPTRVIAQPVVRQTVTAQPTTTYTESQINDFVSKCRTFLTTLLRLAEKQAPEKLPMVRSCIQELLDGTIDPESFTQRLHTLYKSQPHISLVPFFKLALPHMRQIVQKAYGRPITIDLLEKLQLPSSNSSSSNNNTSIMQGAATSLALNPSLLSQQHQQQHHPAPVLQQPLYTTVQPQQKINILQQGPQQTVIGNTASLLGQQQQQQQARFNITGIRPLVTSLTATSKPSVLTGQHQVQPVTQMIIQQSDSPISRSFLPSNNSFQQPQIITVNHQPIKTETIHTHPAPLTTIASIQQKTILKSEDDASEHLLSMSHTHHMLQDDRFIPAMALRRRLMELEKEKRMSGVMINDDAALELISNAAKERLKYLMDQVKLIALHRIDISMKNDSAYQQTSDVKGQIRFLEDLDKIEKQKKDKLEQEKIIRAAKSRSKTNDPEAAKLKQKAKEMQQAQVEEQRQKEANETALAAIGNPKKRKLVENTNHIHPPTLSSNGPEQISPIQPSPSSTTAVSSNNTNSKSRPTKRICRANLRDLLSIMERDKYLKRKTLLVKALNK